MLVTNSNGATVVKSSGPVIIGSKFTGKNLFVDTANGYCWSVGQMLTQGEQLVQAAINRKDNKVKPLRVDSRMVLPRPVATALVTQMELHHD